MIDQLAVVGDIHGNANALSGILNVLEKRVEKLIFVGDYVDRGSNSSGVLSLLIEHSARFHRSVFIAGNHDVAFCEFLAGGSLVRFLRVGGAPTIQSYLRSLEGDVAVQAREAVPLSHRLFLERLQLFYEHAGLLVTHGPDCVLASESGKSYHVFGHVTQKDGIPKVRDHWAAIDTGCGTSLAGRLTGLFWPSRRMLQVDGDGHVVRDDPPAARSTTDRS